MLKWRDRLLEPDRQERTMSGCVLLVIAGHSRSISITDVEGDDGI